MSTLVYGAISRKRAEATANDSFHTEPPGLTAYVDALTAIVPAEVLAIHAIVISNATETIDGDTTITAPDQLGFFFWVLVVGSVALYLAGRERVIPTGWDWIRMFVPAAAFVGWTMLQPTTVFDGVLPDFDPDWRWAVGLTIALGVSLLAGVLGVAQDRKGPET